MICTASSVGALFAKQPIFATVDVPSFFSTSLTFWHNLSYACAFINFLAVDNFSTLSSYFAWTVLGSLICPMIQLDEKSLPTFSGSSFFSDVL